MVPVQDGQLSFPNQCGQLEVGHGQSGEGCLGYTAQLRIRNRQGFAISRHGPLVLDIDLELT